MTKQRPMNRHTRFLITASLAFFATAFSSLGLQAQDPDAGKSIQQVERELSKIAFDILNHDSTELKIEKNKQFITRFTRLLQRPESYNHPFDSIKTVSRLHPEDLTFRIFTWYLVDREEGAYYAENAHYYFGLVQRRHIDPSGKTHYIVMPLIEMDQIPRNFESVVTDNYAWFGALYYQPKYMDHIPAHDGYYYKLEPKKGEVKVDKKEKELGVTFTPGTVTGRQLKVMDKLSYSNHERVKKDIRYYVLTGWNGWDNKGNYKVMEILSFDPQDSSKVNFGAPIIYFDAIPKARALFKYSDFGHFSLNTGYVKRGPFKLFKKRMLIYDHLAPPENARPSDKFDLGPDGSHDGLAYYGKYGGYFEWYRNVEIAENYENKKHQQEMLAKQAYYASQDSATFPDYAEAFNARSARKANRYRKKVLKAQEKAAQERLEQAGIKLKD